MSSSKATPYDNDPDASASASRPQKSSSSTTGQRVWRFLCDLIPDAENPKWNPDLPTVEKVEARLTTDAQWQRRAELVAALQLATRLADRAYNERPRGDTDDDEDPRLTVYLKSEAEEPLLGPELYHYTLYRGYIRLVQKGEKITTIFGHGTGTQAYAKRKAIAEGFKVRTRNMLLSVVEIESEQQLQLAVQRARQRGYRLTVVTSLAP